MTPAPTFAARLGLAFFVMAASACQPQDNTTTTTTEAAKPAQSADATPEAARPAPTGGVPVAFELVENTSVGALQVDIEYTGEGRFLGDADAVACTTKLEGVLSTYNHIAVDQKLRAAYVTVQGFAGPVRIAECRFDGTPKAEDFTVIVRDSASPEGTPVDGPVTIKAVVD